jgi:predicted ATP-dependent endonuclease of OLD family
MQILDITIHNFRSIAHYIFNLGDYSLMVGANNSGKSNVMDALRIFYEKGLKYEHGRDFPKIDTEDNESWIEIEFSLSNDEHNSLKDEWKQPDNCLKVRKYLQTQEKGSDGKPKLGIFAYNQKGQIATEHFYGAKNVQQGKLGDIIYIPAVSKLDEHTKLTGPSALRDLLNDILKKLVKSSSAFSKLTSEFETFSNNIKTEKTEDKKSLAGLEYDITENIKEWDAAFELNINPVSETDIVKNLVSYKIIDSALNERMEAEQFGQGFQRHLIFTLIQTAARYSPVIVSGKKKEFKPDMTLLLFEEPEAFLHPMQQNTLCMSLKTIGSQTGQQVFISSHSPHFVSHNSDDIPSIIRLCRDNNKTVAGQIGKDKLIEIFSDNQQINDILKGTSCEAEIDDWREEMEAVKYFLWLNPERCGLFFSRYVLLVEGPTERVLLNYLIETEQISMPKGGVFILDCLGKFNIHRFMNILNPLKIKHSVLFDADNEKSPHDKVKKLIEDSKNDQTLMIESFPDDLEAYLNIDKSKKTHRKPQHVMLKLKENKIAEDKLNALTEKVEELFTNI